MKFIQFGIGPLGQNLVRRAAQREGLELVGVVDPDPDKFGRPVTDLVPEAQGHTPIVAGLTELGTEHHARVAVISTVSSLERLLPQVQTAAQAGLHIVSTCEELSYPWQTAPDLARLIHEVCTKHEVACVGTGVNPGFLMDYLPAVLSGVCHEVHQVTVERIQDASMRRVPFQQKIGAGLTVDAFEAKRREGRLRHVGLRESVDHLAAALNWGLDEVKETLAPVIAEHVVTSGYTRIEPGMAAGVEQVALGFRENQPVIKLRFRAAVGEAESFDAIQIRGVPDFRSVIPGGINGDIATCAVVLNAMYRIVQAQPGLTTMIDLPAVICNTATTEHVANG